MPTRTQQQLLDKSVGPIRRAWRYAHYDWTREMPRSKRVVTWVGYLLTGYAFWALWSRSLIWPLMWPKGAFLFLSAFLLYVVGNWLMNGMLTSEFVRKTQLEADQIAARQIQETLHPGKLDELPGYEVETFYEPLREVGGDYFDVIDLAGNRTLFAVADVSGKACRRRCWRRTYRLWLEASRVLSRVPWRWLGRSTGT